MKSLPRAVLIVFLLSILAVSTELAYGKGFFWTSTSNHASEISSSTAADAPSDRVFLNQTFENETVGATPTEGRRRACQFGFPDCVLTTSRLVGK